MDGLLLPDLCWNTIIPFLIIVTSGIDHLFRHHLQLSTVVSSMGTRAHQSIGAFLIADPSPTRVLPRHRIRWLWFIHAIHHSQENLNPLTGNASAMPSRAFAVLVRTIPVASLEARRRIGRFGLFQLIVERRSSTQTFGLTSVRSSRCLVSPQFHRVHHSSLPQRFDKNFG